MIVGISAPARSGKDEVGKVFVKHGFKKVSFADELKDILAEAFSLDIDVFYNDDLKDTSFDRPIAITNHNLIIIENRITQYTTNNTDSLYNHVGVELKSPRDMMQYVGTEVCRGVDDELWLKAFKYRVNGLDNIVCPDVRLPNERALIKELNGFLFWVDRPNLKTNVPNHVSETSYGSPKDYDVIVVNDGTLENLRHNVSAYLRYIFPQKVFYLP